MILATPTTLVALLRAVAYGWRQEQLARNAQRSANSAASSTSGSPYSPATSGRRQGPRGGRGYNQAVGSLESRVLPAARRFKDLGAATGDDIPQLEPLVNDPRAPTAPAGNEP